MNLDLIFLIIGLYALTAFILGISQIVKRNPYGLTHQYSILGIFVWGDAVLISPFWMALSTAYLKHQNLSFSLFAMSVFWSVRSLGEMIYWLNQQFATHKRDLPETLWLYKLVRSDAIWFMYQVFWQMILVISIIGSVYHGYRWIVLI